MTPYRYKSLIRMPGYSVMFTFLLLATRIAITGSLDYANYYWNTVLASVPLIFASLLLWKKWNLALTIIFFCCWLLFLPNAPYLITDLVHFEIIKSFPGWVDIILVTSATWNGLLLGMLSLLMMEEFLLRSFKKQVVQGLIISCMILIGYGVYLGRFLRYNSWDLVGNPYNLMIDIFRSVIFPMQHLRTWGFTILFGVMFSIFYYTLKQLQTVKDQS